MNVDDAITTLQILTAILCGIGVALAITILVLIGVAEIVEVIQCQ